LAYLTFLVLEEFDVIPQEGVVEEGIELAPTCM
jgi:hypothetical protein